MELHELTAQVALATPDGWELHEARITELGENHARAEVHFDLPPRCLDQAVFLEVDVQGESVVALCEHQPPPRPEPGSLYLNFACPTEVRAGSFGELIDVHRNA